MAGRGLAPKQPGERRRYNQPMRGEWVDLQPLETPVLGPFDRECMTVRPRMWDGWRHDPVTSQYSDADIEAIYDLALEWADMTFADRDRRMTYLALNPKGKRDLRWRTPNEVKTLKKAAQKTLTQLRVVTEEKP